MKCGSAYVFSYIITLNLCMWSVEKEDFSIIPGFVIPQELQIKISFLVLWNRGNILRNNYPFDKHDVILVENLLKTTIKLFSLPKLSKDMSN